MNNKIKPIIITGATGVGKSKLAIELAKMLSGEIISADSMQIYKHLDIGTAKIMENEMDNITHHMINIVNFNDNFSVADFQKISLPLIKEIIARKKTPIIVGGTGLYLDSLIFEMDFDNTKANMNRRTELESILKSKGQEKIQKIYLNLSKDMDLEIDINNMRRVMRAIEVLENSKVKKSFKADMNVRKDIDFKKIVLQRERKELYGLIDNRVDTMLSSGLVDEVRLLLKNGLSPESQSIKAIGYRQIYQYLIGEIAFEEAIELIKRDSRRYAKRQITWFKKYKDALFLDITNMKFDDLLLIVSREVGIVP